MGSLSYEEYFPCAEELTRLEKNEPTLYETYWELICHYYICLYLHPSHGNLISLKSWTGYLIPDSGWAYRGSLGSSGGEEDC